jgi:hypothetical protein
MIFNVFCLAFGQQFFVRKIFYAMWFGLPPMRVPELALVLLQNFHSLINHGKHEAKNKRRTNELHLSKSI